MGQGSDKEKTGKQLHGNRITPCFADGDPYLLPYKDHIQRRSASADIVERELTRHIGNLSGFAAGHLYFGLHLENGEWVFREWAPNATGIYFLCDRTHWEESGGFRLYPVENHGVWELRLPEAALCHGDLYRLKIHWGKGSGHRIPAYAARVVQDAHSQIFNAQVWHPDEPYPWKSAGFKRSPGPLYIYEVHIGMAQDKEGIGTYAEFTEHILPRIIRAGYNMIQIMGLQEHPYYASFGYQVANYFAPSSRFGTPEELKALIDSAHEAGIAVIMDIIHSHSVLNEVEGLSRFDGTPYQYFHEGERGYHPLWNSRCFDYGKPQVLHFLLSNCRFWLEEYRVDGFRFDGVTSMLYTHHGSEKTFVSYADYFNDGVDEDAVTYLILANRLIHTIAANAVTIAEDVSGMPGLAAPLAEGGMGFDYRFAMGIPDYWIRLTKDFPDEKWPLGTLWHELTNRRRDEKTISYAESHDQALVGDQTLAFRLMGAHMYTRMSVDDDSLAVDRGMALHKMIRLITLATAGHGYLNFMGNEFGHPEWIDFPREGNHWSYRYARRQWHLADDPGLKYHLLSRFDRDMIHLAEAHQIPYQNDLNLILDDTEKKVLVFTRGNLLFAYNFHPVASLTDYTIEAPPGKYLLVLDTDRAEYGGYGRIDAGQQYFTIYHSTENAIYNVLSLYLPSRCALVLNCID